jgi:hypothetical protein
MVRLSMAVMRCKRGLSEGSFVMDIAESMLYQVAITIDHPIPQ